MKGKFFLSVVIGFIFFNSQFLIASGDPSISLSPANGTTYEGGINGAGKTVEISYNVSNLESCWWQGSYKGFEVWLYIDGNEVAYHRDAERHPVGNFYGLSYSNTLNYYLSQDSHTIKVKAKNFEVKFDLYLDTDEASKTNTVNIIPPPTLTVDNNFTDQSGTTHGSVTVSGFGTQTAPFSFEKNSGQNVSLTAVSPQTDNTGYQRTWYSSGTNNSDWKRNGYPIYPNQTYSFTVQSEDNGAIYTAYLLKVCDITFSNEFSGSQDGGEMKVNGGTVSAPTSAYNVVEENAINVEATYQYDLNYIKYTFDHWENEAGGRITTFYPSLHKNYKAVYTGRPIFNEPYNRNLHFNSYDPRNPETNVVLYWNEHSHEAVTQYQIWRQTKYNGVLSDPVHLTTVNRGTKSWTDYS